MSNIDLPPDLVAFLSGDRVLECDFTSCEIGEFSFHPLQDVHCVQLNICGSPDENTTAYYAIHGFDLLARCSGYNPAEMFVFLPDLDTYGSFDCDHESLIVFRELTITQFLADPVRYINAIWGPDPEIADIIDPVGLFPRVG